MCKPGLQGMRGWPGARGRDPGCNQWGKGHGRDRENPPTGLVAPPPQPTTLDLLTLPPHMDTVKYTEAHPWPQHHGFSDWARGPRQISTIPFLWPLPHKTPRPCPWTKLLNHPTFSPTKANYLKMLCTTDVQNSVFQTPLALCYSSHISGGEHLPNFTVMSMTVTHAGTSTRWDAKGHGAARGNRGTTV